MLACHPAAPKEKHTPGAKSPGLSRVLERSKAEALGYLEAKAKRKTTTQAGPPPSAKDDN